MGWASEAGEARLLEGDIAPMRVLLLPLLVSSLVGCDSKNFEYSLKTCKIVDELHGKGLTGRNIPLETFKMARPGTKGRAKVDLYGLDNLIDVRIVSSVGNTIIQLPDNDVLFLDCTIDEAGDYKLDD